MTSPLVDPQLSAFFSSDPSILPVTPPPVAVPEGIDPRRLHEVEVALAAAFLVLHRGMVADLVANQPVITDPGEVLRRIWRKHAPLWLRLAVPAIQRGYELGRISGLTQPELEAIATAYAEDLGEYINQTSADAVVQGFHEQLNSKWSEQLAWHRAASAWGLDPQQMQGYVRGNLSTKDEQFSLLPKRAQAYIQRAVLQRAMRIAGHEAWAAMEMGKAVVWMAQKNAGTLPADAQKEWLTAEDERVCVQCGPLDHKRVLVDEQFVTPDGNKFWAPGVHPNCRCDIKLIYPEISNDSWQMVEKNEPGDPYDRDQHGRFARVEQRHARPKRAYKPVAEREQQVKLVPTIPQPVSDDLIADVVEELMEQEAQHEDVKNPWKQEISVLNPWKSQAPLQNPWRAEEVANPFAEQAQTITNPFARAKAAVANTFKPTPRRRRQILVILPGQPNPVPMNLIDAEEIQDAEPVPSYTWASEHYAAESGASQDEADMVDHVPHETLNFNYTPFVPGATPALITAKPWSGSTANLIDEAETRYGDIPEWAAPEVRALTRQYHSEWHSFRDVAETNVEEIIMNIASRNANAIRIIHHNAGNTGAQYLPIQELAEEIVMAHPGSNLHHSYLDYVEAHYPELVGGPDGPGRKLADIESELEREHHLKMHTPSVYIIDEQHEDTAQLPDGDLALGGRYEVRNTIYRSAELLMGEDRPDNIKGVKLVYLDPVDAPSDEPTDDEIMRLQREIEWDENDLTRRADEAQAMPPGWNQAEWNDIYGPEDKRWSR